MRGKRKKTENATKPEFHPDGAITKANIPRACLPGESECVQGKQM
jgi:hypothetical protein